MTNATESFCGADLPSFRHLKLFDAVARLRSVRKASEECHLSQPAVTQAIARLESQLGFRLLERHARGSYLNEYGSIFHRRAERMFAQIERALADLGVPAAQKMSSRITRSQVKSLVSIVENGSFARAVRSSDVSQPSMHRAARDLERALRRTLYHRTASGIIATPAGAELARGLKLAMHEIELGIEELQATKENVSGSIVIGVLQLTGSLVLPTALSSFTAAHPQANVRISSGGCESMLKSLRNGDVDCVIGLVHDPLPADLSHEDLAESPYVVVGRRGHPLAGKRSLTVEDLSDYDWVIASEGSGRRLCFESIFCGRKRPPAHIETYSLPTIKMLVESSDRLTLMTSYELLYQLDSLNALHFGPITPVHSIGVTVRRDWLPTALQASFIDFVRRDVALRSKRSRLLQPTEFSSAHDSKPGGAARAPVALARDLAGLKRRSGGVVV